MIAKQIGLLQTLESLAIEDDHLGPFAELIDGCPRQVRGGSRRGATRRFEYDDFGFRVAIEIHQRRQPADFERSYPAHLFWPVEERALQKMLQVLGYARRESYAAV